MTKTKKIMMIRKRTILLSEPLVFSFTKKYCMKYLTNVFIVSQLNFFITFLSFSYMFQECNIFVWIFFNTFTPQNSNLKFWCHVWNPCQNKLTNKFLNVPDEMSSFPHWCWLQVYSLNNIHSIGIQWISYFWIYKEGARDDPNQFALKPFQVNAKV